MTLHQVRTLDSSLLICVSSNDGCLLLMTRQVSSAKSIGRQLVEFGKLFINKKNNNGPSTTLYAFGLTFDLLSLTKVYCFQLKKDFIKRLAELQMP